MKRSLVKHIKYFNKISSQVHNVYATLTLVGCNPTPSIPSANAFGNAFFIKRLVLDDT